MCCNKGEAAPATATIGSARVCGSGVTSRQRSRSLWWPEASQATWTPVVAARTQEHLPQHVWEHGNVVLVCASRM